MKQITLNDKDGWKWRIKYVETTQCLTLMQYNKKDNIHREVSIWNEEDGLSFLDVFIDFIKTIKEK